MSKMAEAEVSLRLAEWLLRNAIADGVIEIAIDGAQLQTGGVVHFDLSGYLAKCGWNKIDDTAPWQCTYQIGQGPGRVRIHSNPGKGDVVARLRSGKTFRAECKKGPLVRSKSSQEYPLLREALGQLLTVEEVREGDVLAVAVPHSDKFAELADRWRKAPLVRRFGIRILTVSKDGSVDGFEGAA
jgi:hypothetical protein